MANQVNCDLVASQEDRCPSCAVQAGLRIVYGYPSSDLLLDARQGRVALGGCVTTVWEVNGKEITFDPDWRCGECAHTWQDEAKVISAEDMRALLSKYSHLLPKP